MQGGYEGAPGRVCKVRHPEALDGPDICPRKGGMSVHQAMCIKSNAPRRLMGLTSVHARGLGGPDVCSRKGVRRVHEGKVCKVRRLLRRLVGLTSVHARGVCGCTRACVLSQTPFEALGGPDVCSRKGGYEVARGYACGLKQGQESRDDPAHGKRQHT
eukprot:1159201-Pelagomonas_calceolata.AAC.10